MGGKESALLAEAFRQNIGRARGCLRAVKNNRDWELAGRSAKPEQQWARTKEQQLSDPCGDLPNSSVSDTPEEAIPRRSRLAEAVLGVAIPNLHSQSTGGLCLAVSFHLIVSKSHAHASAPDSL